MRLVSMSKTVRGAMQASVLLTTAVLLSGCLQAIPALNGAPQASAKPNGQYYINQALAGLALGDYAYADQMATQALSIEPANPIALLAAGGVYQHTARPAEARAAYQAAASMPDSVEIPGDLWGLPGTLPVRTIAQHALGQLDGKTGVTAAKPGSVSASTLPAQLSSRHAILKALRDKNLITPGEYEPRKSAPIPASMKGPVPTLDEIADRLEQIAQAYATRNLTANEHFSEREEILDSLVPLPAGYHESPEGIAAQKADPTPPPAKKEEKAPEKGDAPAAAKPAPPTGSDVGVANPDAVLKSGREPLKIVPYTPDAGKGTEIAGPSVHLASFRSRDGALRGWELLKKKYPDLQPLQPRISTLTLPDQGTFYRLNAGPLPSMDDAKAFCDKLNGQFCEPVMMGG